MSRAFDTIRRDKLLTVLETFVNDSELRIIRMLLADTTLEPEPGRSTLNVLNYKYKYFPPGMYLSTSTFLFGEMYLSTFRVLSKCT